jgi:uncharacterized membrane protein YfcA
MDIAVVAACIFVAALLYSSVGNAGASGYLAVMALCGVSAVVMKPVALCLNILVATIATIKFHQAGCFSWPIFWPFAITSVPLAFAGGAISLPSNVFKPVVGLALVFAAFQLLRTATMSPTEPKPVLMPLALVWGAVIGLTSGLTATGGGIFLAPLLLFMGWAKDSQAAGIAAAFNLSNSVAGLVGQLSEMKSLPGALPYWALAAGVGGWIGAEYGSRHLGSVALRRLLAFVLFVAGAKMAFT